MQSMAFRVPYRLVRNFKAGEATCRSMMNDSFHRLLLEESQIIYFEYRPLTDTLCISLPGADGQREWRSVHAMNAFLLNAAYVPVDLQQSFLTQWMNRTTQSGKESLSLCLDVNGCSEYRWYICHLNALCSGRGKVDRVIGYLRDVHGERENEQKLRAIQHEKQHLEERATLDAVTGLLNRGTLEERAYELLCDSVCSSYFFIFDIDNFKAINDSAGHCEGDRVLREVANVLRQYTRSYDLVGRIGGDEFVALLGGLASPDAARERANMILRAICEIKSPAAGQGDSFVSLSVGIAASVPGRCRSYQALYNAADQALYQAKKLGKNCCCIENG
ncbi:MAG: GGDEF domain-containing protein [Eubacteriales bacterium]|nr:GGDEF domain-containing protein [Eubacteriales bacterium]